MHKFILSCVVICSIGQVSTKYYGYYGSGSNSWFGSDSGSPETIFLDPVLSPADQKDKDDAAAIVKSNFDGNVIASIFANRSLEHRIKINNEIGNLNKRPLIHEKYLPNHKKNPPLKEMKDLWFALINYPIKVLAMYLGEFLHRKDETYVIMVLTLCQEMRHLKYDYDKNHKNSLNKRRQKQRHPFANLMKVWVERDRDPADSIITDADIAKDVESMKNEWKKWNDKRDSLENTLIRKCFKFSSSVIQKFEADVVISIEDAINHMIKNHDLVDAYISLVNFVKNKYHYMAKTLLDHCSGVDQWAIWIMYVGFVDPKDWPKIDEEFKKISGGKSLKDYILSNAEPDKTLLKLMAAKIDNTYKPTFP